MSSLRFLQLGDVHFGQGLRGGKLRLPPDQAARRVQERRDSFRAAVQLVQDRDLDGILIPGDLFDHEAIDTDTLRFVLHTLGSIAPRPVFIAPGNHDPYAGSSPYTREDAGNTRGLNWPDNVRIFAHDDFRTLPWPGRSDVSVTGCGVAVNRPSEERRLRNRIGTPDRPISLLLFHGSRDDSGFLQADKSTYPFSADELLGQEFRWTALGHYHAHQVIQDEHGRERAAYSGCLTGSGLDEQGPRGVLVVSLDGWNTDVEFVRVDPRVVHDLRCDLSGANFSEEALQRLERTLAGIPGADLVRVRLVGRRTAGLDLGFTERFGRDRWFHLLIDSSELRPDLDVSVWPAELDARTIEERYVARLREEAENSGPARRALLYGLDALQHGRLDLRYED